MTGALGLIFAAVFARSVATFNQTKLWVLYTSLTLLHIVANMQCMKLIAFDSFNNARMNLIVDEFLTQMEEVKVLDVLDGSRSKSNATYYAKSVSLSSPSDIAKVEPLFFVGIRRQRIVAPFPVRFGVSLDEFSAQTGKTGSGLETILYQATQNDKYVLATAPSHGVRQLPRIAVSFLSHASPEDQAKAYYHAMLLSRQLKDMHAVTDSDIIAAEAIAKEELERTWGAFSVACKTAGWDLKKTELHSHGYELELIS